MSKEGVTAVRLGLDDALVVFESLSDEEWSRPSGCAGWRVHDVAAHAGSNFKATVEPPAPSEPLPVMPAERMMDLLVEPRRDWSADQVLDEIKTYGPRLLETLEAMQSDPLASTPMTMADLGTYEMHQLAEAYAFDLYCHLRIDVLAPHGPVERDVPTADAARLGPALAWMLAGLPQMQGAAFPFVERPLTLHLTGPGGGSWTISGSGDGTVEVTSGEDEQATARITSGGHAFVSWATKRSDWRADVTLDGDRDVATRFLDTLNVV